MQTGKCFGHNAPPVGQFLYQTKLLFLLPIDELKLEILLLSSKLSSYQKSYEELQTTLEEMSKSQEISEKTVVILKNQLVDDDQKMATLTAQNAQLNGQIQTLSEEKRLALKNLHEKVSPIYLPGGIQ